MTTPSTTVRRLFSFPDPVNEVSARLVAGGVLLITVSTLVLQVHWLVFVLAYGFFARVLTGPTLSPLGQLVTRVITPRLSVPSRAVPGPPKRFAQGVGFVFTTSAAIATALGHWTLAEGLLGVIVVAATLESVFAYCIGCKVFNLLIKGGVIPESVCERCVAA